MGDCISRYNNFVGRKWWFQIDQISLSEVYFCSPLMRQHSLSFSHISSFGRRRVPLVNEIGLSDANKIIE